MPKPLDAPALPPLSEAEIREMIGEESWAWINHPDTLTVLKSIEEDLES